MQVEPIKELTNDHFIFLITIYSSRQCAYCFEFIPKWRKVRFRKRISIYNPYIQKGHHRKTYQFCSSGHQSKFVHQIKVKRKMRIANSRLKKLFTQFQVKFQNLAKEIREKRSHQRSKKTRSVKRAISKN